MDHKEKGYEFIDWIDLTRGGITLLDFVNTVTNVQVIYK
jgi:hypothetical protein